MDFLGVHFGAQRLRLLVLAWQSAEMASTRALLPTIYTAGNHSKTTLLSLEEESVIPTEEPSISGNPEGQEEIIIESSV